LVCARRTLSQNASLARSCFRLFRWIDEFCTAYDSARASTGGALWLFSTLRGVSIGTFILMNNLFWGLNWKILTFTTAAKMKQWASYVRLVAESSGLCWMVLKHAGASKKLAAAREKGDEKAIAAAKESRTAAVYKAIVFICNFTTYTDISGTYDMVFGSSMSQVLFGVLGTISGVCGMREPWCKSAVKAKN